MRKFMSWSHRRTNAQAEPIPEGRQSPHLQTHPPEAHAQELLRWLRSRPHLVNVMLTVEEMRLHHDAMCAALGWRKRPWNPVAKHLREITSRGRKTYDCRDVDGVPKRVRVYSIAPT